MLNTDIVSTVYFYVFCVLYALNSFCPNWLPFGEIRFICTLDKLNRKPQPQHLTQKLPGIVCLMKKCRR